jgi:hypothetical protein
VPYVEGLGVLFNGKNIIVVASKPEIKIKYQGNAWYSNSNVLATSWNHSAERHLSRNIVEPLQHRF